MKKLENFAEGKWITGDGDGQVLTDAINGEPIAAATSRGIDFKGMIEFGHSVGNPNLRKLTFHERGRMLRALALHLRDHLEKFYAISYKTGATKGR
jgi:oxepin-CoA hydrolase/3-oxo-5,6-dehydrosuberyl-CoA semialdehyde dehydrogenase